jgi:hypothetical protein
MTSNRLKSRHVERNSFRSLLGCHAHACVGMLALALVLSLGCETKSRPSPQPSPPTQQQPAQQQPSTPPAQPAQQQPATPPQQPAPQQQPPAQPAPSQPAPQPPPAAANPPPATPPVTEKKAEVGVGKKGRGYGQGIVATPAASLFAVRERLVFEVQIPQAMQLFEATEGRPPKDHDEFMEKIIKANNIKLPELPEGDRYRYYPKEKQLMVESPKPE